jgi:hypothetical protein
MALAYLASLRNTRLDAITTAIGNAGLWRIYDNTGAGRPATCAAITTQVLLAELTCGTPFAAGAAAGVLTIGNVTADASANATGTATWARLLTSGATATVDMNVGTSGSDLNLTTTSIVITQPVSITNGATITEGNP